MLGTARPWSLLCVPAGHFYPRTSWSKPEPGTGWPIPLLEGWSVCSTRKEHEIAGPVRLREGHLKLSARSREVSIERESRRSDLLVEGTDRRLKM